MLSLRSINPQPLPIFSLTFNDSLSLLVFYLCRLPVNDCTFCEPSGKAIKIIMWGTAAQGPHNVLIYYLYIIINTLTLLIEQIMIN